MICGRIFNIQKFSIHDGPGIRTAVFFRGCPLRCRWCANPESQDRYLGISDAVSNEAYRGRDVDVDEVLQVVLQDMPFYEESGGGLTMTGGEPLRQSDFAAALAAAARENGVHVAMETTGFADPAVFARVAEQVDLLLFDVKHFDSDRHREGTGVGNEQIVRNLKAARRSGKPVIARIPVIPHFNTGIAAAAGLAELICDAGVTQVELLPFHQLGEYKYHQMGVEYAMEGVKQLNGDVLTAYRNEFIRRGLDCRIG